MPVTGIRLSYRCEAHLDYLDDGQEVEVEEEEEEDSGEAGDRGHRRQKKRPRFGDTVTPKRRTATEKFLETTTILWGTGKHMQLDRNEILAFRFFPPSHSEVIVGPFVCLLNTFK